MCREEPQYEGLCVSTETNLRAPAQADRFGEATGVCCGTWRLTQPKQKLLWKGCDRHGGALHVVLFEKVPFSPASHFFTKDLSIPYSETLNLDFSGPGLPSLEDRRESTGKTDAICLPTLDSAALLLPPECWDWQVHLIDRQDS